MSQWSFLHLRARKLTSCFLPLVSNNCFPFVEVFLVSHSSENTMIMNINRLTSSVFLTINSNLHHRRIEKAAFGRFLTSIFGVRHMNDIISQLPPYDWFKEETTHCAYFIMYRIEGVINEYFISTSLSHVMSIMLFLDMIYFSIRSPFLRQEESFS